MLSVSGWPPRPRNSRIENGRLHDGQDSVRLHDEPIVGLSADGESARSATDCSAVPIATCSSASGGRHSAPRPAPRCRRYHRSESRGPAVRGLRLSYPPNVSAYPPALTIPPASVGWSALLGDASSSLALSVIVGSADREFARSAVGCCVVPIVARLLLGFGGPQSAPRPASRCRRYHRSDPWFSRTLSSSSYPPNVRAHP